jgi:hypothetical protein
MTKWNFRFIFDTVFTAKFRSQYSIKTASSTLIINIKLRNK